MPASQPQYAPLQASAASAARRVSGLVSDTTSRTATIPKAEPATIDTRELRMKRMRYNVIASATFHDADMHRGGRRPVCIFGTLTYRENVNPEPKHMSDFGQRMRVWLKRAGETLRMVWVAELTQRGRLHYHFITWLPHGWRMPMPDKRGWWPHGHSQVQFARSAVGYIAKYAGKFKGKALDAGFAIPKGFRIYGVCGLDQEDRAKRSWANLPGWLRDHMTPDDRAKRIVGGGWISRLTHDFYPSIWKLGRIVKTGGGALITLLPALPEGTALCSPY